MTQITVFLDSTGRPIGSCPVDYEQEWLSGVKGDTKSRGVARQVRATDAEWREWAKRNMQAGPTGRCVPW